MSKLCMIPLHPKLQSCPTPSTGPSWTPPPVAGPCALCSVQAIITITAGPRVPLQAVAVSSAWRPSGPDLSARRLTSDWRLAVRRCPARRPAGQCRRKQGVPSPQRATRTAVGNASRYHHRSPINNHPPPPAVDHHGLFAADDTRCSR